MSNYLDTMFDETMQINDNANVIKELSRAFYATGNMAMSNKLSYLANDLLESSDKINKAVGVEVNDRCRQSQQAAENMVVASLAISTMSDA